MKERSKELKTLQNAMGLGLLLIHRIFFFMYSDDFSNL